MSLDTQQPKPIVHIAVDEAGSLASAASIFVMAAVVTARPEPLSGLIPRVALRSGKRLDRPAKKTGELKWSNASQRIRAAVLTQLAEADVELFTLTIIKSGRRIEDSPRNYGAIACELLSHCWDVYPHVALSLDRHFTAPAQVAVVNTLIHRCWPVKGVLSVTHVDSQRHALVQLADMVAGSVYTWHKDGDGAKEVLEPKIGAALLEDWRHVKARWLGAG